VSHRQDSRVFGKRQKQSHTIIFASGETIRHVTVRPWIAGLAACPCSGVMAIGYLAATSYLVLRDDLIGASMARQARMQHAYEDRIAALQFAGRSCNQPAAPRSATDGGEGRRTDCPPECAQQSSWQARARLIAPAGSRKTSRYRSPNRNNRRRIRVRRRNRRDLPAWRPVRKSCPIRKRPASTRWPMLSVHNPRGRNLSATVRTGFFRPSPCRSNQSSASRSRKCRGWRSTPMKPHPKSARSSDAGLPLARRCDSAVGGPFVLPSDPKAFEATLDDLDQALGRLDAMRRHARKLPIGIPAPGSRNHLALRQPAIRSWAGWRFMAGLISARPPARRSTAPALASSFHAGRNGGYGKMIEIDHGNGLTTRYAHLSKILVNQGDKVAMGSLHRQSRVDRTFHRSASALRSPSQWQCRRSDALSQDRKTLKPLLVSK
jgi:hypothetical protein